MDDETKKRLIARVTEKTNLLYDPKDDITVGEMAIILSTASYSFSYVNRINTPITDILLMLIEHNIHRHFIIRYEDGIVRFKGKSLIEGWGE